MVDFTGVKFLQGGNNTVFSITNSGTVWPVSALIPDTAYNLGDGALNTIVAKITATGHGFQAGDIGKIFSDDIVPDNENSSQFRGEYFVVGAVVGDDIYTTGNLIESYSTNIKVVKPSDAVVHVRGLSGTAIIADGTTASFATFQGFTRPIFEQLKAKQLNATFLNVTGCFEALVDVVDGDRLKNRPDLGAYGYLVNDSSSFQTIVRGIRAGYVRHAYTTTSASAVAGDDKWYLRGRTFFSHVLDSQALGGTAAFDTHYPAYGITFSRCKTIADFRGNTSGGAGFQLRGNKCRVLSCEDVNSKIGVAILAGSRTDYHEAEILDFDYSGPNGHVPVSSSGASDTNRANVRFSGRIRSKNSALIDISNTNLTIDRLDGVPEHTNNQGRIVDIGANSKLIWDGGRIDYSGTTTNTHALVRHADATAEAYVSDVTVSGG